MASLDLDDYERDNLRAALVEIMDPSSPARFLHTGDWTAMVLHKLGADVGRPNLIFRP